MAQPEKKVTSYRLTLTALDLLKQVAFKLGISRQDVLELAIRAMAKEHGVKVKP